MKLIKTLTLSAGPQGSVVPLEFEAGTVTVFVGPNHSGKSILLKEIHEGLPRPTTVMGTRVLRALELNPFDEAMLDKIRAGLNEMATEVTEGAAPEPRIRLSGTKHLLLQTQFNALIEQIVSLPTLHQQFGHVGQNMANRLCLLLGGSARLSLMERIARGDLRTPQSSVLGVLFRDDRKRAEFQRIILAALGWHFAVDVTVEDKFGAVLSSHPVPPHLERSLKEEALEFFSKCEDIPKMSDGVKAFSGMMAAVIASEASVILVDEPEAFLHPALCTKLATELCRKARENGQQLLVATHSAAFLLGCIQAGIDLNIVRLTYRQGGATSRVLSQTELIPLMRQPLLRSIGALNGIFYEAVVVTESEADRAFYDEINHRCVTAQHEHGIPECLFLNAQNWQTAGRIVQPLRRLGVAAAAIVDIDVVSSGDNASFQNLLDAVGMPVGTRQSLGQLRGRFTSLPDPQKRTLKQTGSTSLGAAEREDLQNLLNQLGDYGVFVVPNRELESWLPALSRRSWTDKREWLLNTFEAMGEDAVASNYLRPQLDDVWGFIGCIRRWVHNPQRRGMQL